MKKAKFKKYQTLCKKSNGFFFKDKNDNLWLTDTYSIFRTENIDCDLLAASTLTINQDFGNTIEKSAYNLTEITNESQLHFKFELGDGKTTFAVYTTADGDMIIVNPKYTDLLDDTHMLYLGTAYTLTQSMNYVIVADDNGHVQGMILPIHVDAKIQDMYTDMVDVFNKYQQTNSDV